MPGVDLVGGVDEVEGYVRRKDLDRIASDYGLVAERARPNGWLHVVDDPWPFENGDEVAPSSQAIRIRSSGWAEREAKRQSRWALVAERSDASTEWAGSP